MIQKIVLFTTLFLSTFAFSQQSIEVLTPKQASGLKQGDFVYTNASVAAKLQIESETTILVDFALTDLSTELDSVVVSSAEDHVKMEMLSPFLIKNINESNDFTITALTPRCLGSIAACSREEPSP